MVLSKPTVHTVVPYKNQFGVPVQSSGFGPFSTQPFLTTSLLLRSMLGERGSGEPEVRPVRKQVAPTAVLHCGYWSSSPAANTDMEDLLLQKCCCSCNNIIHCKNGRKLKCTASLSLFAQHKHIIRWYMRTELMAFANC